jgi:hypothetical protein
MFAAEMRRVNALKSMEEKQAICYDLEDRMSDSPSNEIGRVEKGRSSLRSISKI